MRLIDADYVLSKIGAYAMHPNEELVNNLAIAFDIVVDAPTVDAVEVVRCKDYRWVCYCETDDMETYIDCDCPDGGGVPRNEEWYCADGERKETDHE